MKLTVCITADTGNYVVVTEETDGNQYLPEGSALTAKNRFAYEDTASVDILKLNSTTGEAFTASKIVMRSNPEDARIKLEKDGWFTSMHMVIPTQDWVYAEMGKTGSIIRTYDIVYFTDGNSIFTYESGKIATSSVQDMIDETSTNTTISRVDTEYFSISLLQGQLTSLYAEIFENRLYNGGCGTDSCEATRLLAIMSLIKHYVRWNQLAEAERVVEKANYFEDSKTSTKDSKKTHDCGCL